MRGGVIEARAGNDALCASPHVKISVAIRFTERRQRRWNSGRRALNALSLFPALAQIAVPEQVPVRSTNACDGGKPLRSAVWENVMYVGIPLDVAFPPERVGHEISRIVGC